LRHKPGHRNNTVTVEKIESGIASLPAETHCKLRENKVDQLGRGLLKKLSDIDKSYDRRTDYGETEDDSIDTY